MARCRLCKETIIKSIIGSHRAGVRLCDYCFEKMSTAEKADCPSLCSTNGKTSIIAPFTHVGLSKLLIHNFKYRRNLHHGRILTHYLVSKVKRYYHCRQYPDFIIPIPSHATRITERSFSHTDQLGNWLSHALKIQQYKLLARIKNTAQQAGLSRSGRLNNMKGSFAIDQRRRLHHHYPIKCVMIDDVVTTGATMYEAQRVIHSFIPNIEIDIWCLAQVPGAT